MRTTVDKGDGWFRNYQIFADVLYGWPLTSTGFKSQMPFLSSNYQFKSTKRIKALTPTSENHLLPLSVYPFYS